MEAPAARCDVVIVGGGVAGLWVRYALSSRGFSVVLVEHGPLGAGQTLASQGILHAGFKYAITEASQRIAEDLKLSRAAWESAMAGAQGPDLRSVRVLAEVMYFWSVGLVSRAAGAAAAGVMRSGVRSLGRSEFPSDFAGSPAGVHVWEVTEKAVDPISLVRALSKAAEGPMVGPLVVKSIDAETGLVRIADSGKTCLSIRAEHVVLAAGEGNADLLHGMGIESGPIAQTRPLHQVFLRPAPVSLFGHCIQVKPKPRLTITTSTATNGDLVWYLGGDLAESGVDRTEAEQVECARKEIAACLPWLNVSDAKLATLRINRAEGRPEGGGRPEGPVLRRFGRVLALWPTKLAMAPGAAQAVVDDLRRSGAQPGGRELSSVERLPVPPVVSALCDSPSLRWR